jgi:3-deoxy-manno-octulosonate cytidylyltransferase (CMP-KDO synthetase)
MTSSKHINGTERIAEAAKKLNLKNNDIIIDVQGDEPLIDPKQIDNTIKFFKKNKFEIVLPNILMKNGSSKNIVKLVFDKNNQVRWMSRAELPFYFKSTNKLFYKHLSIIAFTKKSLSKYANLKPSKNEKIESIELLRALENNLKVGTFTIKSDTFSVDILEDYLKAKKYFMSDKIKKNYL